MSNSDIIRLPKSPISWAELQACSNFSFLKGGSHPEEYMDRAALLGLAAVAIADGKAHHQVVLVVALELERGVSILCLR